MYASAGWNIHGAIGIRVRSVTAPSRRAGDSGYRGHDASHAYSAQDELFQHDSIGTADAERVRQDLLQVRRSCCVLTKAHSEIVSTKNSIG